MQTSTISSTIETIESNESNQIVESTNSTESKESFYECCICMVDDKKIYNIYKCPECKNIYCYNCLRTYIYDYSNLTPHCPQCDTVIPFIEVFNSLILIYPKDSNIPVCHIIQEYVEKAADVIFHLELQGFFFKILVFWDIKVLPLPWTIEHDTSVLESFVFFIVHIISI